MSSRRGALRIGCDVMPIIDIALSDRGFLITAEGRTSGDTGPIEVLNRQGQLVWVGTKMVTTARPGTRFTYTLSLRGLVVADGEIDLYYH